MYHTIIIVGNLGREPELRYLPNGQAVCNFSVATNRKYTGSNGETVEETIWFRVASWGKQAETINQYLHKGSKVVVEGRLTPDPKTGGPRIWQGQNGPAASYEITASTVRFLSSRTENEGEGGEYSSGSQIQETDEIPF